MTDCSCSQTSNGKGRNLVVNLDGTSNQYGANNTNVVELFSRIAANDRQLKYYNSGVGTYARPSWRSFGYVLRVMENWVDLAIAWNFERVLIGAYRWLSDQYQEGDRIFLFGFSRGAYQVRALAGMIETVGLIHRGNEEQIPFAYELYADRHRKDDEKRRFKRTFSVKDVHVHFIGVWDTVSSVGIGRSDVLPLADSCDHVCYFRHALALDERRVKFMPECIMKKGKNPPSNAKEVWFAGSHSDVGGGTLPNEELNLQSVPLLWMENEALLAGLHLQQSTGLWDIANLERSRPHNSLNLGWRLFEYLPIPRGRSSDAERATWRPHLCRGRVIIPGQKIHASVACKDENYTPRALFDRTYATSRSWADIIGRKLSEELGGWKDVLELDLFDLSAVPRLMERLEEQNTTVETRVHIVNRLRFSRTLPDIDEKTKANILKYLPISELLELIKGPECQTVASTLAILAYGVECSKQIVERGGIPILMTMLKGVDSKPRSSALVLRSLMGHAETREKVLEADAVSFLVDMLHTADCGAAASALSLLDGASSWEFSKSDAIPDLLRTGRTGEWDVVTEALMWLADNEHARLRLVKENAAAGLAQALKFPAAQKHAAETLAKMAQHAQNTRSQISRTLAIPLLVAMLDGDHVQPAAEALRWLCIDSQARAQIIEAGAIPHLIQALREPVGRKHAATILAWLAYEDKGARVNIIHNKAIPALVHMLLDSADCPVAVEALKCLIWDDEGRDLFLAEKAIPLLVQSMNYPDGRKHAAYALACLAEKSPECRGEIVYDSTAIPILVLMLDHPSEFEVAATTLRRLASNEEAKKQIVQANAIPSLVSLLKSPKARDNAALVLLRLACDDNQVRAQIILRDAIPALVQMMQSDAECATAIEALKVLSWHADGKLRIVQANLLPWLVRALEEVSSRKHAAYLLVSLAEKNRSRQSQIVALGAVPALILILKDADVPDHHRSALTAMQLLVANDVEAQAQILLHDSINDVVKMMKGSTAGAAARVLEAMAENYDARKAMVKYGAPSKLVFMLGGKYYDDAGATLITLSKYDDMRSSVVNPDVIPTLVAFGGKGAVHSNARALLRALAVHSGVSSEITSDSQGTSMTIDETTGRREERVR